MKSEKCYKFFAFLFLLPEYYLVSYISSYICFHFKNLLMGNLGFQEILLIAVVVLVLFGGRKIPEFMKGLGRGVREFNDAKNNVKNELEEGMNEKDQRVKSSVNPPSQEPTAKS